MAVQGILNEAEIFGRIGLQCSPFPVTPDATHYFCSNRLHAYVIELLQCIHLRKGFLLFTADVGLGKSTLSRYLMLQLKPSQTRVALIINTFLQGLELLQAINEDFSLNVEGGIKQQLKALNLFLLEQYQEGNNCVIIIDDAQNLSVESLELIRQISNLEANREKLVQILLIAQPEIMDTLNQREIRQLKSRIAVHIQMEAFDLEELKDYVRFRLSTAGNNEHIDLTETAAKVLLQLSQGYPRQINLIMDRVLYALLMQNTRMIVPNLVRVAFADLQTHESTKKRRLNKLMRFRFSWLIGSLALVSLIFLWVFKETPQQGLMESIRHVLDKDQHQLADILNNRADEDMIQTVQTSLKPNESLEMNRDDLAVNREEFALFLQSYDGLSALSEPLRLRLHFGNEIQVNQFLKQHGAWRFMLTNRPILKPFFEFENADGKRLYAAIWQPSLEVESFLFGAKSEAVGRLQTMLNHLGFYKGEIDQTLGKKTMYAIANFQRSHHLEATGVADQLTLYLLLKSTEENSVAKVQ
ncbi:MAG: AAA family ATPase [Moraxella osloensis]|nr:AAA family ATPase [Moraxella osloensis]